MGFHGGSDGKESACIVGDSSSIPVLGRSPGEQNGYRGAWQATVKGVSKESDRTKQLIQQQYCGLYKCKNTMLYPGNLYNAINQCSVQFSRSVVSDSLQPMDCSTPDLPIHHNSQFTQSHVH